MFLIESVRNFYGRFERPISSASLILGFVFDALILKRVDTLWENFWIFIHILIIGVFIVLVHMRGIETGDEKNPGKAHFWYVNILQFVFGGVLSAYLVFYFRSADILVTWPFIAILALAFIANESLKRHYIRFSFQISLFFLSIYSFAIFLVPVVLHKIGNFIFLLSGILSVLFIFLFIKIFFYFTKEKFTESKTMIFPVIFGIFTLVNLLYFTNLIPPIPLSLKDAGVYHSIQKNKEGNYEVTYEDHGWQKYFTLYQDFHEAAGSPIYAFSAIFSPRGLNLDIVHQWQRYEELKDEWVTEAEIDLHVIGGRDGGFRTYSVRSNLESGKWRVNIKTKQGQTIGHLRFNVILSLAEPELATEIK